MYCKARIKITKRAMAFLDICPKVQCGRACGRVVVIGTLCALCGVRPAELFSVCEDGETRDGFYGSTHVHAELADPVCLLLRSFKSCKGLMNAKL